MTKVSDIFDFLAAAAPLELAESYDNPGLLVGDPDAEVKKAMLSLDISSKTAEEAAQAGAQLVISHHPVIFHPVKSVLAKGRASAVWSLAKNSLSAVCMHTNLDSANGGVNDVLAGVIGLSDVKLLSKNRTEHYKKITVFVPESHAEQVRAALAKAGAGKLGNYDGCAFETSGSGYFRPLEGANPYIGENGKYEKTREVRIEAICPLRSLKNAVRAMLKAHPYEVPAYDIFDDEAAADEYGIGRIGSLARETPLRKFAESVKSSLGTCCVRVTSSGRQAYKIAVCSGAVDEEIIERAADAKADTLVTGEMKHNLYYTALEAGINIVEAGHFATETVVLPELKVKLESGFPGVSFDIAKANREPYYAV